MVLLLQNLIFFTWIPSKLNRSKQDWGANFYLEYEQETFPTQLET